MKDKTDRDDKKPAANLPVLLGDFIAALAMVFFARKFVSQLIIVVLPGGRRLGTILPLVGFLAILILLSEWFEYSFDKFSRPKYWRGAIALWGVVSCFAIGYMPYKKALDRSFQQYRKVEDGTYTFQPGISFRDIQPGAAGKKVVYSIDDEGNRACDNISKKTAGNIILAGDSYIFGLFLEEKDTLCRQLGEALRRRGSSAFSLRNLGVAGLNIDSTIKKTNYQLGKGNADWIIISYLSRNDFSPYDSFYEIQQLQETATYKALAMVFGPDTLTKSLNWFNNRYVLKEPEKEPFLRRISGLKELAKKSNVIIVAYWDDDAFIKYIETNMPEITVVKYDLGRNPTNEKKGLIIPGDGHPTGKANRALSEIISDIIANKNKSNAD